jgi:hypothetical protein
MLLAEKAALSEHGSICEDGPELPKEKGQEAAQEGGETLEGMYAQGRESLTQAKLQGLRGQEQALRACKREPPPRSPRMKMTKK